MAKKKKKSVLKPWCWYCDREFDDDKVLINHQKAKHFKCSYCHKKMNTIGGLVVHLQDVHKEHTNVVPNSISGRNTIDIEIFGMEGIPFEDLEKHLNEKSRGEKRKYEDPELIQQQVAKFSDFTTVQEQVAEVSTVLEMPRKIVKVDGAVLVYSSDVSPVIYSLKRKRIVQCCQDIKLLSILHPSQ